ncbi:hypothetical protein CEXT_221491 [Caerostris extrusa]|uniref:Uncharacterized protein n=1 Tax=Caerostris extrusa TaxID=172846 RepID=A0AAV4PZN9_CAEEX|nr:hypothetical protein CEXT_221491 [Caerostris extrusa]
MGNWKIEIDCCEYDEKLMLKNEMMEKIDIEKDEYDWKEIDVEKDEYELLLKNGEYDERLKLMLKNGEYGKIAVENGKE